MKKVKQIIALLGVILLIGMYCTTIIMAILSSKYFFDFLMASIYATVVIPVLLWIYTFVYQQLKKRSEENKNN